MDGRAVGSILGVMTRDIGDGLNMAAPPSTCSMATSPLFRLFCRDTLGRCYLGMVGSFRTHWKPEKGRLSATISQAVRRPSAGLHFLSIRSGHLDSSRPSTAIRTSRSGRSRLKSDTAAMASTARLAALTPPCRGDRHIATGRAHRRIRWCRGANSRPAPGCPYDFFDRLGPRFVFRRNGRQQRHDHDGQNDLIDHEQAQHRAGDALDDRITGFFQRIPGHAGEQPRPTARSAWHSGC